MTAEVQERLERLRGEIDQEKSEIMARAREIKAEHDAALADLRQTLKVLKAERQAQGLSLADVRERTGITRSALCRLETDLEANPTVATLCRYADALGKRVMIVLADKES